MAHIGSTGRRGLPEWGAAPISSPHLERYRLRLRQSNRANLPGAHLVRRRGQGLEFREFRPYVPGDDIRYVDWRASARHGHQDDYLVRAFELESQTRIVISLDTRASMRLPIAAPKLRVACWLAEVLAYIAGRSGDTVALHDLFGRGGVSVVDLGHATNRPYIRRAVRYLAAPRVSPSLTLTPLARILPPASIWLVITDLYFNRERDVERLVAYMHEAQRGGRWVILLELDSWPHEKQVLGKGLRRIDGPGLTGEAPRLDVTTDATWIVEDAIDRRRACFNMAQAGGYNRTRWTWPAEVAPSAGAMFRRHFFSDRIICRLLMKEGSA